MTVATGEQWYALYTFRPGDVWPGAFLGWFWATSYNVTKLVGWMNCLTRPDGSQFLALDQQQVVRASMVC